MCASGAAPFSVVLACAFRADRLSVNTSVPCELCCFKSLARGFISQTDVRTKQETDFLFLFFALYCFNETQKGVFDSMFESFLDGMCLRRVYVRQTEDKCGESRVLSDVFQ